jgi:hypothetical protein
MLRTAAIMGVVFALGALPASANHPHGGRIGPPAAATARGGRLAELAHQLERAAHQVHARAERIARHGDRRERRALRALHELDERARHFHAQVERGRRAAHVSRDFAELRSAFWNAEIRLHGLHTTKHVLRDFGRVARVMGGLERVYARWEARLGHRGHGHFDAFSWSGPRPVGRTAARWH